MAISLSKSGIQPRFVGPKIVIGGGSPIVQKPRMPSERRLTPKEVATMYNIPSDEEILSKFPPNIFDPKWAVNEVGKLILENEALFDSLPPERRAIAVQYLLNEKVREQQANLQRYNMMIAERDKLLKQQERDAQWYQKQIEKEEKEREKEEALREKLEDKYRAAEARAREQVDKALDREYGTMLLTKGLNKDEFDKYEARRKELEEYYRALELSKAGFEPETDVLKRVPANSPQSIHSWIKKNLDKSILDIYEELANAPNYRYTEEDFRDYPNLAKALAMIHQGITAPFTSESKLRKFVDPAWSETVQKTYLDYQPSTKSVDQILEETKREEEAKKVAPKITAPTKEPTESDIQEYIRRAEMLSNYINRNANRGDWWNYLIPKSPAPQEYDVGILGGVNIEAGETPEWQKTLGETIGRIGRGLGESLSEIGSRFWSALTR